MTLTDEKPKEWELENLGPKPVNIVARVQADWRRLMSHFHIESYEDTDLKMTAQDACRDVFQKWLHGGNELLSPKSWKTLIGVLKKIGYGALADEVKAILLEQSCEVATLSTMKKL